jgi:Putative transposase
LGANNRHRLAGDNRRYTTAPPAIANSRLISVDERGVAFKWKDYRIEGRDRYKHMTLATDEFISRFLNHVLPNISHQSGAAGSDPSDSI